MQRLREEGSILRGGFPHTKRDVQQMLYVPFYTWNICKNLRDCIPVIFLIFFGGTAMYLFECPGKGT